MDGGRRGTAFLCVPTSRPEVCANTLVERGSKTFSGPNFASSWLLRCAVWEARNKAAVHLLRKKHPVCFWSALLWSRGVAGCGLLLVERCIEGQLFSSGFWLRNGLLAVEEALRAAGAASQKADEREPGNDLNPEKFRRQTDPREGRVACCRKYCYEPKRGEDDGLLAEEGRKRVAKRRSDKEKRGHFPALKAASETKSGQCEFRQPTPGMCPSGLKGCFQSNRTRTWAADAKAEVVCGPGELSKKAEGNTGEKRHSPPCL